MEDNESLVLARELMTDFARRTGLSPEKIPPKRYLWTDAFAVCNFLELFRRTGDEEFRIMAARLVNQVHRTLGRHREDDSREGWISGLGEEEGRLHPTAGGLRIGKKMKERRPEDPFDEALEWERDGQYYHYLTKWMHALHSLGRVTKDPVYDGWAIELVRTAHERFTEYLPSGGRKKVYWKMSIDLSRPLLPAMGQHDPLDGLVTYSEVQAGTRDPLLKKEIAEMAEMTRVRNWGTEDPLGTGGLLFDGCRVAQLEVRGEMDQPGLLESILESALAGLEAYSVRSPSRLPAGYRLAFRELGLSIGLKGLELMARLIEGESEKFAPGVMKRLKTLGRYKPMGEEIVNFWADDKNRREASWTEHREINMVMLATSLAPEEFLTV